MRIRASIAGFLLVAVLGSAGQWTEYCNRIGESVAVWSRSYRELNGKGTYLNSLDRLVLTVMLANSKRAHQEK